MSAKPLPWTDEEDKQLLDLVGRNWSGRRIAEEMSKSRHAIIGRVYRLRKILGRDIVLGDPNDRHTHQVGLCGRLAALGKKYNARKPLTREEKAARSRLRWTAWETKNGGAVMSSIKAARKAIRKEAAMQTMRNHIVCCSEPREIWELGSDCCRWIVADDVNLWLCGDEADAPYKGYCCNFIEPGKPYCSAHQKLSTEYVAAPFKQLPNRKGAVTIVPHHWKKDSWRAA